MYKIKYAYNYFRYNTTNESLVMVLHPGIYRKKLNSSGLDNAKISMLSNSLGEVILDGGDDGGDSSNSQPFFDFQNNSEVLFQDIVFNNFTYSHILYFILLLNDS